VKEISTVADHAAEQQRACERSDIFRHFSGNLLF